MDTGHPCGSPDRSLLFRFPIRFNRVAVKPLTPLVVASPMDVPTQPVGGGGCTPADQVACYECHGVLRLNLFDLHQKASALKALGKNWGVIFE